ncbi:acyl CoA:acetate/3-ketoacid CoA transferase (plasmid) [Paraburkholderia sp. FT54]|uniref:acyl CoA:acetate/3-ketoacid CoA transferase n=1 Tax=Paraburkholderia sp. FT54 TaxID=3074437 RepID=UPI0028773F7F|nr:acyl CoA:acetate/3-ketoacid CoA transferase [Paraburkholderia sp. FT54]WNC95453.1 acyl CoA:acetate/3-ketoacid CoA transferase [Paraburkholderia sp. FT54]
MQDKIVTADDAIGLIRDGDAVCCSGFVGIGTPDELITALARRFTESGFPRDLTLVFAAAPGDGKDRGLNRVALEGLVKRAIGGHWSLVPKLARMATENLIEAYNLPLGTMSHLYRDIAAHRAGTLTQVGLGTFVDPRQAGGKINARTTEDLVSTIDLDGKTWLLYKVFPLNVALIRGTTADPQGNITMEREALVLDAQAIAMAVHNSNGLVIAQVERIAASGTLDPRAVVVPGIFVDRVVVASPDAQPQTYGTAYNPAFSSEIRMSAGANACPLLDERKVMARRCAFELPLEGVINLGIGVPEVVGAVAAEERLLNHLTLTAEPGIIGGVPQGGLDFGAAVNMDALLHQNQQFDFYDGGGLDLACLGMAQIDRSGNVNVSRFGPRLAGAGGFINISQNASRVVFAGAFTAGGLEVAVDAGRLRIVTEGSQKKLVESVEQITFNGRLAAERGQPVLYVTERCVFRLTSEGLELTEVAPGIDVDRDILPHMDFAPIVSSPRPMNSRIFLPQLMNLATVLLDSQFARRLSYKGEQNTLFANFEGMAVRSHSDIESVRRVLEAFCQPIGRKVSLIVNYDGFRLDHVVADQYFEMAARLQSRYYKSVSRFTSCAFMRAKLRAAFRDATCASHVCETHADAMAFATEHNEAVGDGVLQFPRRRHQPF